MLLLVLPPSPSLPFLSLPSPPVPFPPLPSFPRAGAGASASASACASFSAELRILSLSQGLVCSVLLYASADLSC